MHYGLFAEWLKDRVDELVGFGVPRNEAEMLMRPVELGAICAEARVRSEDQFLLDLKRVGSKAMAERHGMSEQGVRKRRTKLLNRNPQLRAELR